MAEKDNNYTRWFVFLLFTGNGILYLVKNCNDLINFYKYEKELTYYNENKKYDVLDSYNSGIANKIKYYYHSIPKSESDIKSNKDKDLAVVTYYFIITIIICYFIYLMSLFFINKSTNNRKYKKLLQYLLFIFILIISILSIVISAKSISKYDYDFITNYNKFIKYHDFYKKKGVTTEKGHEIVVRHYLSIVFCLIVMFFNLGLTYDKK